MAFILVVINYLSNNKSENYDKLVKTVLNNFIDLGYNTSMYKTHHLYNNLDSCTKNLGDVSEEQSERFQQDLKIMEGRCQGRWNIHTLLKSAKTLCEQRVSYKKNFKS